MIILPGPRVDQPIASQRRRGGTTHRAAGRGHSRRGTTRPTSRRIATVVALLAIVLAACGADGDPDLQIGAARASERLAGASQVVVTITNDGDGDDTLVDATTPAAAGAEIHHTTIEEGRATMATLDQVEIPAGETVSLEPGGLHLMLVVPDESVVVGGTFELTLRFQRSGELTVPVQVVPNDELLEPATAGPNALTP